MKLDYENFELFAAHHYDVKKATSYEEFQQDLKKFTYLKKLFLRFEENDDLQVRLILNHLIVLYNCFGQAATPMLFMKLEEFHSMLKPFVLFIGFLPKQVEYCDVVLNVDTVIMDRKIIEELRKI